MNIYINARFLTQHLSGVQRYAIECSRQIKIIYPTAVFLCPKNIVNHKVALELGAIAIGSHTGHLWEQIDLPFYLFRKKSSPLLNLANTAPLLYSNNYVTIHDLAYYHHPEWNTKLFSIWYNILIPRLAYNSKHLFTVSNTVKSELITAYHLPPEKISVTYNGIAEDMLADQAPVSYAKENIILSVGSFNIRKNHQNLIKAFLVSNIRHDHRLVIIGERNKVFKESGFDEQALTAGNIEIHEGFTDAELIGIYKRAKVVVSLSLYEGFGIPLLEGIYYGCKIICSNIPVYKELYSDCALFCDPLDIKNVTAALNSVASIAKQECATDIFQKYNYASAAKVIVRQILK